MKKFFEGLKAVIKRFASPVVLTSIAAIFVIIISAAGYSIEDLESWKVLGVIGLQIISSPAILISIAVAIFGFINNPSSKKKF